MYKMDQEQPRQNNVGDEKDHSPTTGAIRKSKEEKKRKRDQRSWENIERNLINLSEGEKLAIVKEKYNDIYQELRKTKATIRSIDKQLIVSNKERDHFQAELSKAILQKTKLESLCRELQKQNKQIKEENITRIKEEEERRREVATSFTEKLNTLTSLMDENKDKSVRLREENLSMTSKLTELYDQFQEREGHLATVNRQMEIQKKLSDAQYRKLELEFQNAREIWEKERQTLLSNLDKSEHTNMILQQNIKNLEEHIDVYKSQYSDFEATMHKSNKVFDAFKEELGKMNKAKALLEKERNDYRQRWQTCTNSIVQMTEMQQQTSAELKVYHRKVTMLEKLCRQLHSDRAAYIHQLEVHKIKPAKPSQLEDTKGELTVNVPPLPKFTPAEKKQLFAKEKLIAALKSELKVMEDQLKDSEGDGNLDKPSTSGLQRQAQRDSSTDETDVGSVTKPVNVVSSIPTPRCRKTRRPAGEELSDTSPECDEAKIQMQKGCCKRNPKKPKSGGAVPPPNPMVPQVNLGTDLEEATSKVIEKALALELPKGSSCLECADGALKGDDNVAIHQTASGLQKPESDPGTKEELTNSTEVLFADLSLDSVPLCMLGALAGNMAGCFVKESEAHTNLLQLAPEATTGVENIKKDDSSETIVLQESEAKTEIGTEDV